MKKLSFSTLQIFCHWAEYKEMQYVIVVFISPYFLLRPGIAIPRSGDEENVGKSLAARDVNSHASLNRVSRIKNQDYCASVGK
jgi:hypothetical protein